VIPGTSSKLDAQLSFVSGDTWLGIPSITVTPAPVDPCALAEMQFRINATSNTPAASLSSADGSIVITDAANWEFYIPEQNLTLKPGNYVWSLRTTDDQSVVQTYMQGSIVVLDPITRNARSA